LCFFIIPAYGFAGLPNPASKASDLTTPHSRTVQVSEPAKAQHIFQNENGCFWECLNSETYYNVTLNEVKGLRRKAAGFFSRFAPSE
jgi:hypothetical protein